MGRKGDIESKSVSSRVPMEVFLKLQTQAFAQKKTMSGYLCDLLSKDNFSQGGQTKIEYRDKLYNDHRLVRENEELKTLLKEQVFLIDKMKFELKQTIKDWATIVKDQNREIDNLKGK